VDRCVQEIQELWKLSALKGFNRLKTISNAGLTFKHLRLINGSHSFSHSKGVGCGCYWLSSSFVADRADSAQELAVPKRAAHGSLFGGKPR